MPTQQQNPYGDEHEGNAIVGARNGLLITLMVAGVIWLLASLI